MITLKSIRDYPSAGLSGDTGLGNKLFQIAAVIGMAVKHGYDFGFEKWESQEYFINPLPPVIEGDYPVKEFGWDYSNEWIPDNVAVQGYFQDYRYWIHCVDLIKHYFETIVSGIGLCNEDIIGIHFRAYGDSDIHPECDWDYYSKALELLPKKKIIVFTDNIDRAKKVIPLDCEFISNSPIDDFINLKNCEYIISSNSTFPWWAGVLGGSKVIIPSKWFGGRKANLSTEGFNYPGFIKI